MMSTCQTPQSRLACGRKLMWAGRGQSLPIQSHARATLACCQRQRCPKLTPRLQTDLTDHLLFVGGTAHRSPLAAGWTPIQLQRPAALHLLNIMIVPKFEVHDQSWKVLGFQAFLPGHQADGFMEPDRQYIPTIKINGSHFNPIAGCLAYQLGWCETRFLDTIYPSVI